MYIDTPGILFYGVYMPRRNLILSTNEIYHVFNRSVAREHIFSYKRSLNKALEIVEFYRYPQAVRLSKLKTLPEDAKKDYLVALEGKTPLVELYAWTFMPNHYHFLLKQLEDNGIKNFISNFQNSFAKFFNIKNNRNGALFQNPFHAKLVETDEQFMHISRYIHLNPVTSHIIEFTDLTTYPYTSFNDYTHTRSKSFINTEFLLGLFGSREAYVGFTSDQVEYQRELHLIKDLIME